jgi:hypothetical protein
MRHEKAKIKLNLRKVSRGIFIGQRSHGKNPDKINKLSIYLIWFIFNWLSSA